MSDPAGLVGALAGDEAAAIRDFSRARRHGHRERRHRYIRSTQPSLGRAAIERCAGACGAASRRRVELSSRPPARQGEGRAIWRPRWKVLIQRLPGVSHVIKSRTSKVRRWWAWKRTYSATAARLSWGCSAIHNCALNELGPPEFKSNERFEKSRQLRLIAPRRSYYVYDMPQSTEPIGKRKEITFTLDPYEPAAYPMRFCLSPRQARPLSLTLIEKHATLEAPPLSASRRTPRRRSMYSTSKSPIPQDKRWLIIRGIFSASKGAAERRFPSR